MEAAELEAQVLDRLDQLDLMLEEVMAQLSELQERIDKQASITNTLKRSMSDMEDE